MKFITFLVLFFSFSSYSQTAEEIFEQMIKEREQMMGKISQMFADDDFFSGFDNLRAFQSGVSVNKVQEDDGSISVLIVPTDQNMKLDISTSASSIKITAKTVVEEKNDDDQSKSFFSSSSSSTQIVSIPEGYSASEPKKQDDGSMKIVLSPGKGIATQNHYSKSYENDATETDQDSGSGFLNDGRIPIGKAPGESTI